MAEVNKEWLEEQLKQLVAQSDAHAQAFHATLGAILAVQGILQRLAEAAPEQGDK